MTTAAPSTALATIQPAFTDAERFALAGFLPGYRGRSHRPPRRPMTAPTAVQDKPLWCRIAGALSQVLACLA
jgi:hypothetical protein